jgi:heme-degrading monooxygenase HmoA
MYARVVTILIKPGKEDEIIRIFEESIIPTARKQKGFKGLTLMIDRETRNAISISMWEEKADMIANETSGYYQEQVGKIAGMTYGYPVDQHYEVFLQGSSAQ